MRSSRDALPVLGWKEHVALPEWGIRRLRAKLDTGARSSAIHVADLEILGVEEVDGEETTTLRFAVVLGGGGDARRRTLTVPSVARRTVRDTGGRSETRYVVRTRVVCGPLDRVAEVTVTDRTGMNFRMILGRTLLAGACLVDPDSGYRHSSRHPPRRAPAP